MTTAAERLRARTTEILADAQAAARADEDASRHVEELVSLQLELAVQQDELAESHHRLAALTEHYRHLFEAAPIGFVRISKAGEIEDINVAARVWLGLEANWRQRGPVAFARFFPALALPMWRPSVDGAPFRTALLGARGTVLAEIHAVPWRGDDDGWLVVITDVTELSDARARQLEAEERFGLVARQMSEGLVVVDAVTGLISEHNEAFAAFLGYRGETLVGQPHDDLLAPASGPIQRLALRQALRDGRHHALVRYAHADKTERVADVTVGAVRSATGSFEYLVVRDMTERFREEEERRRVDARLAETQKLEALGMLAAGVAHDMNNLLTAVLTATELPPSPETLADLRTAALRGRELTERLLAVSRRKPLRREPFDLLQVADEVVALTRRTFAKSVSVSFERPEGKWSLEGDVGQWHQALLNLLINARDALPGSGEITISTEQRDGLRSLLVRDQGAGMSPEVQRRAFEPFFSTRAEGTGLGLAHVRAVVAAHGGTATIDSAPGRGTTIRLELPAKVSTAVKPAGAARRAREVTANPRNILVVDDEAFVLRATARVLARLGHTVSTTPSVPDAIRAIETGTFDLVVSDRSMPLMSGDQLCRAVRCRWPDLPVIVMTGQADDRDVEALQRMGAVAVVSKPYTIDELAAVIDATREAGPVLEAPTSCGLPAGVCSCAVGCGRPKAV